MKNDFFWRLVSNMLLGVVIALALLLAASKLPIPGNYKVLTVLSGSMEPAIKTGAAAVIRPAAEYKVGDIITFANGGDKSTPVTHRILSIDVVEGKEAFTTKGDANEEPDPRPIDTREIFGKVMFSIPFLGYVLEFLRQPLGFVLVVVLPALAIIADEILKIAQELRRKEPSL